MTSGISSTASALRLQTQRLRATANNVANLNTEGFRASTVAAQETRGGGVQEVVSQTGAPSPLIVRDGVQIALSNTGLVQSQVDQISVVRTYQANAAMMKTWEELDDVVLDLKA